MRRIALAAGWAAVVLAASTAEAIPAFARKYQTSCMTCHGGAPPMLNAFGRQVLEGGLQLPDGAEEPVRDETELQPGTLADRLAVLSQVPLSLRAQGTVSAVLTNQPEQQRVALRPLEQLMVMAGGSVYRNVSFFAAAELAPTAQLHHGALGVHNLFGEGALNFRAGQLLLFDFLRPEHRELSSVGNPIGGVQVGANPTRLDTTHLGVDAYGRLFARRMFWHVALVEGGRQGLNDLDAFKDVFAELQVAHRGVSAGAFGYFGRTQLLDTARGTAVRFSDPFRVLGGFGEATVGPATFYVLLLHGRHENADGWRTPVSYLGLRGQLDVQLSREVLATVRYDNVGSATASLGREYLTSQLTYLALSNLKVSGEYISTLHDLTQSSIRLRLDLAF